MTDTRQRRSFSAPASAAGRPIMTGLVAAFDSNGKDAFLADLVARLPTQASRSEEWHDEFCAMAHLHHGAFEATARPTVNDAYSIRLFVDGDLYNENDQSGV